MIDDQMIRDRAMIDRAYGTLLGQCIGDALGAQVEFSPRDSIRSRFPDGVREMTGGGPHNTKPGQITDDSELALALARVLAANGHFDANLVAQAYVDWYRSGPFDCGGTCGNALSGAFAAGSMANQVHFNALRARESQANGALMRCSPIGVSAARMSDHLAEQFARDDAALTHVHHNCQIASAVLVVAIRGYVLGFEEESLERAFEVARRESIDNARSDVFEWIVEGRTKTTWKADHQQGYVRHGIQNAIYQAIHAPSFEEGIVSTINLGGDTDTNAAIAGALLGAKFGADAIPERWIAPVLRVQTDRPATYWTHDLHALAVRLVEGPPRE